MVGLGFGLFLAGYTLAAYGWSQVRGCNSGLVGIVWPGSFKGCNPDTGGTPSQGSPTAPTLQNPNPKNPITAPPKGSPAGTPIGDTPFGGGQPYIVS